MKEKNKNYRREMAKKYYEENWNNYRYKQLWHKREKNKIIKFKNIIKKKLFFIIKFLYIKLLKLFKLIKHWFK